MDFIYQIKKEEPYIALLLMPMDNGLIASFTDSSGKTLYTFKYDNFEHNNFTKEDFSNNAVFPIYETEKTGGSVYT